VQPLEAPPRVPLPTPADLSRYPACALFLCRAHAVNPSISIDPAGALAIAEICRRLDGLPLAIELAAAQLKYESAPRLLSHLERRFEVLVDGPRDAPARQQTMRSCIAWSYDLLSGAEQDVLCRLGVFVGGCTPDAAEHVIPPDILPPDGIMPALRALVDKSLLLAAPLPTEVTRFTMLETIRAYVLERLEDHGESGPAHAAWARFYLYLSEQAAGAAWGPGEAGYLRRLAVERDNLQAVLAWTLEHNVELGLRIAGALVRFWNIDGHYAGTRSWIEQALASGPRTQSPVRARALITAGWMALQEGDIGAALRRLEESLAMARALGATLLICQVIPALGFTRLSGGDPVSAVTLFEEGLDLARTQGATRLLGTMLYGLGLAAQVQGDLDRAHVLLAEAVTHFRAHGECVSIGSALRALGEIALAGGNFKAARDWFEDGLQVALRINHRDGIAIALEGTAAALTGNGNPKLAARLWGAAEALHEDIHGVQDEARVPFARLPLLTPHLDSVYVHITQPQWQAAQAEGHDAPLAETLALLESREP
jgi:non-specific serine/threonine protein kinase